MPPLVLLLFVIGYFAVLIAISYFTAKGASDNASFFIANRNSKWYFVAFGMIGTALSGVTFISVPGAVKGSGFGYFQFILGNAVGFLLVAYVLLPLYYKLNLVSIYTYLEKRFGFYSYKTGSMIFLVSRTIGSAFRLYLVALVFQRFIFDAWHIPFGLSVAAYLTLIWLYTYKGGLKTIIITDTLQTVFLLLSVVISIYFIAQSMHLDIGETIETINKSAYSKMFFWDDIAGSKNHFLKQFIGGIFITVAMTGLDQDLMQKNLSCRNIGEGQKNMLTFTAVFIVINLFFLSVGALLYHFAASRNIDISGLQTADHLFPEIALRHLNIVPAIIFMLGLTAATFATTDSALTALTTSFCIDFLKFDKRADANEPALVKTRHYVHIGFSVLVLLIILLFKIINDDSVVNSIFKAAGYTYGPLLGLFSFGVLTKKAITDKLVPVICVLSPLAAFLLEKYLLIWLNYAIGFELILVNGTITFLLLLLSSYVKARNSSVDNKQVLQPRELLSSTASH